MTPLRSWPRHVLGWAGFDYNTPTLNTTKVITRNESEKIHYNIVFKHFVHYILFIMIALRDENAYS